MRDSNMTETAVIDPASFSDFSRLCGQHWQHFHDGVRLNQVQATQLFQTFAGLDAILHLLGNDEPDPDVHNDDSCRLSGYVRGGLLSAAVALNSNLHHLFADLHSSDIEKHQEGQP